MNIIQPTSVSLGDIIETSATDTQQPWESQETYSSGSRVLFNSTKDGQSIYESAVDGNAGKQPDKSPDDWVRVGPSNVWAPFDGSASTISTSSGGFEIKFHAKGVIDSIALLEMLGSKVTIEIYVDETDPPVYTETRELLDTTSIVDAYTYFFTPFDFIKDTIFFGIPPFYDVVVKITIESGDTAGVGEILVGQNIFIGDTGANARHGIRDFSKVIEDDFGNVTMLRGAWSKRADMLVRIPEGRHRYASRVLTEMRGIPAVFIGSAYANHEPLVIYGFIRNWGGDIHFLDHSTINIEIQGLI